MNKFKNWFEMYPPVAAEMGEWDRIDKENKIKYPIRYFLNEVLIPNTWWPVSRFTSDVMSKIRYGWYEKLYLIDTNLSHDYHEVDERLLHGMFSLLVDFVEIEKAWMEVIFNNGYKRPWWILNRFRSRILGMRYLDWEITLMDTSDKPQAESAQIIKDLYIWWVDVRPNRLDPYDLMVKWDDMSEDEKSHTSKQITVIEQKYYDEDTEMLNKLVGIRNSLWT